MLACKFQSAVFDTSTGFNLITCINKDDPELFYTLVNSHICMQCPHAELIEVERLPERQLEKRPPDAVKAFFRTSCSQCNAYRVDKQCCYLMNNSKTMQEMLEDSHSKCPRSLW
jgi:hypothetical protein